MLFTLAVFTLVLMLEVQKGCNGVMVMLILAFQKLPGWEGGGGRGGGAADIHLSEQPPDQMGSDN